MSLNDHIINGLRLNVEYANALIVDLNDQDLQNQPSGFTNHPAWTIGHLTTSLEMCIELLGGSYSLDSNWDALFRRKGPGDPRRPEQDGSLYPTKDILLKKLNEQEKELIDLIKQSDPEFLNIPYQWKFSTYLPTKADYLHFMLSIHFSWHIGQIAEWRRMMGYDSALVKLLPSS